MYCNIFGVELLKITYSTNKYQPNVILLQNDNLIIDMGNFFFSEMYVYSILESFHPDMMCLHVYRCVPGAIPVLHGDSRYASVLHGAGFRTV